MIAITPSTTSATAVPPPTRTSRNWVEPGMPSRLLITAAAPMASAARFSRSTIAPPFPGSVRSGR
jgi:hypothetical protein